MVGRFLRNRRAHGTLGEGALPRVLQAPLEFKLQHSLPVTYKDIRLDCGYRIDVLVVNELIIELKSVEEIKGIHKAQLLTYMKLAGIRKGLLMNFNVKILKDGIKRFVL